MVPRPPPRPPIAAAFLGAWPRCAARTRVRVTEEFTLGSPAGGPRGARRSVGCQRSAQAQLRTVSSRVPPMAALPLWLSAAALLVSTAGSSSSAIVAGQLRVDGVPFFPVGMYTHGLADQDWAWMRASGINTVVTYTNGLATEAVKAVTPANLTTIGRFLDAAHAHDVKVFISLKDFYDQNNHLGAAANEQIVTSIVGAVRDHPALLGYYINDECKTDYLPVLEKRAQLLATLDPHHVLYSLENTGNTARLKEYRNTSTLFGVDPYPWFNASLTTNIHAETAEIDGLINAFAGDDGVATCTVAQIFSWGPVDCQKDPDRCEWPFPPYEVMRAMAFVQPVRGSGGIIQYAYYSLFGFRKQSKPRTDPVVAVRLAALTKLNIEYSRFATAEFLARPEQRTVLNVTGGPTTPAGDAIVWATVFKCDKGCTVAGTVIVVNGGSGAATVSVALPQGGNRSVQLQPWGVFTQRLKTPVHTPSQPSKTDDEARSRSGSGSGNSDDSIITPTVFAGPVPMKDAWIAKLNATNLLKTDDASASPSAFATAAPADRRFGPDGLAPPTMDDLWDNAAHFKQLRSVPLNAQNFQHVDAGTRVVVINETWYLFGRWDLGATKKCPSGEISINVRASTNSGRSWSEPHSIAEPDEVKTCIYADGSAFYDTETSTWHYLVQVLDVGGTGGWMGAHFSLRGQSPFGKWVADAQNPVITSGSLFKKICAGGIAGGKHCDVGMIDEGTFQIVEKVAGDFYVTFHGYDYQRKAAARGVARTADFVRWEVTGGAGNLPGDVIFAAADCLDWNVPWGPGGCIGSGEASILRTGSGYMYQVIEATDLELGCDLKRGEQWWPLGLVRSKTWAASPQWEQMDKAMTPFVGGPAGGEPHVGCSIQYNSLHTDSSTGTTYFEYWGVTFFPANATTPRQSWNVYELVWGAGTYPIQWDGPPQSPPPPPRPAPDCSTLASCKRTCAGFAECPADQRYYCCDAAAGCTQQHNCSGTPGLRFCACPSKTDDEPDSPRASTVLLVDDEDVVYRPQTERVLFQMQRSTGQANLHGVMTATLPWESALSYNSVHYAAPAERSVTGSPAFTLWYQCCPPGTGGQKPVPGQNKSTDGGCVVCLAWSADGVEWTKPRLGLYPAIDGNGNVLAPATHTNIVLPSPPEQDGVPGWQQTHYGAGVVVDPWPAASARRFKMVYWAVQGGYGVRRTTDPYGIYVAFSPDGLNWTRWSTEEPAIVGQSQSTGVDSPYSDQVADGMAPMDDTVIWPLPFGAGDVVDAYYDPVSRLFVAQGKTNVISPDGHTG